MIILFKQHPKLNKCYVQSVWTICIFLYQILIYLPLKNRIKQWCRSSKLCQKMTAHWTEKDHWLNCVQDRDITKRELWDGSCFKELSWFWDPHCEWTLPVCCPFCKTVISAINVDELSVGAVVSA